MNRKINKSRRRLLVAFKVLFSSTLIFLLYRKIPVDDLRDLLLEIDFRYFLPISLLLFMNTVLSALKWRLFLLADSVNIPLPTLTMTYLIGSFYNLFLPSNIGGDSYRIYDIAKKSRDGVRSAASVWPSSSGPTPSRFWHIQSSGWDHSRNEWRVSSVRGFPRRIHSAAIA